MAEAWSMRPMLSGLGCAGVALVAAITLAGLSVYVERIGPDLVEYGDLCGPSGSGPCYEPEMKGGFPFAFLSDAPGVSVQRRLSLGEDKVFVGALVADVAVYFFSLMLAWWLVARRWRLKADAR